MRKSLYTLYIIFSVSFSHSQNIYVSSGNKILRLNIINCKIDTIGNTGSTVFFDIAVTPDEKIYGIERDNLYLIDSSNAKIHFIGNTGMNFNSLAAIDNRFLLAAGKDSNLYKLSVSDAQILRIDSLKYTSAGDLVFFNNLVYLTTTGKELIEIELSKNFDSIIRVKVIGKILNSKKPFGLANIRECNTNRLLLFDEISVFELNPITASTKLLCNNVFPQEVLGADASKSQNFAKYSTISPRICSGDSFKVGKSIYLYSGKYFDTIINNLGCDSIVFTELKVNGSEKLLKISICEGEVFNVGPNAYLKNGFYLDTLFDTYGCDSVIKTNLTVNKVTVDTLIKEICEGEFFQVGSKKYFKEGMYCDTLLNAQNCDSIINTLLKINETKSLSIKPIICEGETFKIGNKEYYKTGNYVDTLLSFKGCDSIINLRLTVGETDNVFFEKTLCDGDTFIVGTKKYFVSGIYYDTLNNFSHCDSIITTKINLNSEIEVSIPNVFTPNGDLVNDRFKIINSYGVKELSVFIYNRWDQIVFESNNVDFFWNGNMDNGEKSSPGTYFYVIIFKDFCNHEYKSVGTVTIIGE